MQAVYSTTTDVKIHKAIRREWDGFLAWLVARQHEIQSRATGQKPTKLQRIQEEFLNEARTKWLACVRARQLHIEHWIMTPEQKAMVQRTLGWTQKDMVDAYAAEQAALGAQYQVVDPVTLGTNEPVAESSKQAADSPRRYMHPKPNTKVPAYANWAAELGKIASPAAYRSPGKQLHESSPHIAELPTMPLYFVGALMHGTDLDAVAAAELEAFALGTSEEKIREYYAEACDATLRFQRHIGGLDEIQREAAHAGFEDRMRELAAAKEREWKLRVLKEMRKHQAAEVQRRAAQHHAMRPRTSPRVPPGRHRDDDRWDHPEEFRQYRSPRGEHLDPYYSPRGMAHQAYDDYGYGDDYGYELPVYNSPRQGKTKQKPKKEKQKRKQQPPQTAVETHQHPQDLDDPQYYLEQVSPSVNPTGLRRKHALHRGEPDYPEYDYYEDHWPMEDDKLGPNPDEYLQEPAQRSWWTKWLPGAPKHTDMRTISSFDWTEPQAAQRAQPASSSKKDTLKKTKTKAKAKEAEGWWGAGEEVVSEEEFPMRREKKRWRDKLGLGRRRNSPTRSEIGWATPSDD